MTDITLITCTLCILTATLCLAAQSQASDSCAGKSSYIIQSHRGAGNLAPENTLQSFELAWKIGTIPEADVRSTSDGVIVAFHDNNLERLAPSADPAIRPKSVNDLPWDVVSKLDVGSYKGEQYKGERIPRISDVLDRMKGHKERLLYLDVKKVPLDKLAALARERGVDEQVILASSHYNEIREWKRLLPKSQTLLWNGGDETQLRQRMAEFQKADFADITQLQIHVNVLDLKAVEPFAPSCKFLREVKLEIKPKGILFQVLVIGSDNPEAYHKLMDLGVESFASDDPMVTLKVMGEYNKS
ncbi:MAG: glycerophosphodiester phosphodiesterase family protein [Armatimonadota bacterium]